MRKRLIRKHLILLSVLSVALVGVLGGGAVATGSTHKVRAHAANTTTYGPSSPTFVGPAATGCASSGCSLLTGPFITTSTTSSSSTNAAANLQAAPGMSGPHAMPGPSSASHGEASRAEERSHARASAHAAQSPTPVIPNIRCQPLGDGCDTISTLGRRGNRCQGPKRGRQRFAEHQPQRRHRATRSGTLCGQRVCRGGQQHRRGPGVQHRAQAPVGTDLAGHHHGAHQPGMEQRRRPVVRVRPEQRRALVLHRDRLGEPRGERRHVHRLLRGRRQQRATRASR